MNLAVDIQDLHVQYLSRSGKRVDAVRGLSLSVEAGEVVGFLGPNGAGKSSTLKALMGFVIPKNGVCNVFGLPSESEAARARVGYLPEVALYYPYLTPLETLTLYGNLQGMSGSALKDESFQLLECVGLKGSETKQNRTLSKGMLQRVGIAQSLLGNPELLILDEVTSGLDPVGRKQLRELLKERQQRGCTLFFSSHELAEVELLCDRILLIHQGKLIEERDVSALKDELRHFSVTFSGNASMVGLTDDLEELANSFVQARFESKELLLQAIERIQGSKGIIQDIIAREGSFEDYFINTITRCAA